MPNSAERPGQDGLRLVRLPDIEAAREEWTELAVRARNLFATWEWASLWWRHFGDGRQLLVSEARRHDGGLAAILPLYVSSVGPLRILRFLGHGPADQLGPVHAPGDDELAGYALREALGAVDERWDVLLGEDLPAPEGWQQRVGGRVVARESSPLLRLDGRSWKELVAGWSANLREQVGRRERKLAREQGLAYRLAEDPATLDRDFDTLLELHRARWGERGSVAFAGRREAFHRAFARAALERGWLRLWIAEVGGEPAAAWYGFRFAGSEWFYQSGRDPRWDRYSVGFVLLVHTLRTATEEGAESYRLLRGAESYKSRFADLDPGLETVVVGNTPAGRAAVAAASSLSAWPRGRRLLRRVVG